jgi:hypothetical protein
MSRVQGESSEGRQQPGEESRAFGLARDFRVQTLDGHRKLRIEIGDGLFQERHCVGSRGLRTDGEERGAAKAGDPIRPPQCV